MKKFIIIPLLLLSIFLFAALFIAACGSNGYTDLKDITNSGEITPLGPLTYDWGEINIESGTVSHDFSFRNDGDKDLIIQNAITSCMCTEAYFDLPDGSVSPTFGMHENNKWAAAIAPGEEFGVKVTFDPMAHGPDGVGAIQRSITFPTSASNINNGMMELTVSADVLYAADYEAAAANTDNAL